MLYEQIEAARKEFEGNEKIDRHLLERDRRGYINPFISGMWEAYLYLYARGQAFSEAKSDD